MLPNIWLHRQPIPKLRSTLKTLASWTNQDVLALALKEFSSLDLDNKQIGSLVKLLKQDFVSKVNYMYYTSDVDTLSAPLITLKPNKFNKSCTNLQESINQVIDIIQDSKVCWEDSYKSYLASNKPVVPTNMTIPLPDNAEDIKKYWGLQVGDKLQSEEGEVFVVTQVKPVLDGPPTITYERLELQPQ